MIRLCERPGCSAPAAVAYGMESGRLLVWLAIVPEGVTSLRSGVLCRRHADAMVVPRGWTLDDRRESTPRLFRVATSAAPENSTTNHPSRGRKKPPPTSTAERAHDVEPPMQLAFDQPAAESTSPIPEMPVVHGVTVAEIARVVADAADPDETRALPWRPIFDDTDDLGGLLKATSPLLSRAFRGRNPAPPKPTDPAGG